MDNKYYAMVSSDCRKPEKCNKIAKTLSFLAELREYHHKYIYKLVKSKTSLVMHIISVAKALKNISHIYISYTVPKKYKRRMHEKFPSLHRGSCKANLLKNGRTRRRKKFLSRLNFNRVTHFRRSLSFRNDLKGGFSLYWRKQIFGLIMMRLVQEKKRPVWPPQ